MKISTRAACLALSLVLAPGIGRAKDVSVGKILKSSSGKAILEVGDKVTLLFKKGVLLEPGSRFTAYKVTSDLMKAGPDPDREETTHLDTGIVEVVGAKGARRASGKVVRVMEGLEPGDLLKREAP